MCPDRLTEPLLSSDVSSGLVTDPSARDFACSDISCFNPESLVSDALRVLCSLDMMSLPVVRDKNDGPASVFAGEFRVRRVLREILLLLNAKDSSFPVEALLRSPVAPFIVQPAGIVEPADGPEKFFPIMAASEGLMVNVVSGHKLIGAITCRSVFKWLVGVADNSISPAENRQCSSLYNAVVRLFELPVDQCISKGDSGGKVICLGTEDELSKALWISTSVCRDFLPVLRRNGQLKGILKTNDILCWLLSEDSSTAVMNPKWLSAIGKLPVMDVVNPCTELMPQDSSVRDAVVRMNRSNQICIGLVNASRDFCGLFSFRALLDGLLAAMLELSRT